MKNSLFAISMLCLVSCADETEPTYPQRVEILPYKNFKEITKVALQQRQADSLKRLTLEYGIYYDKKYIPQIVVQYLSKKYPDEHFKPKLEWSIANPNEKVNLGCTVLEGIPTPPKRQLIALAKKENYCVLYYLQGGIGVHEEIIILYLQNNKVISSTILSDIRLDFMKIVKKLSQKR